VISGASKVIQRLQLYNKKTRISSYKEELFLYMTLQTITISNFYHMKNCSGFPVVPAVHSSVSSSVILVPVRFVTENVKLKTKLTHDCQYLTIYTCTIMGGLLLAKICQALFALKGQ
jgi:hypothetical protein